LPGFRWFGYSNPDVDRLFIEQSEELDRQIKDIIMEELPRAPGCLGPNEIAWYTYLRGYDPG